MGGEAIAAAAVAEEDRYRAGIAYDNPLAGNPANGPEISVAVTAADGSSVDVVNPTATRVALACMNMNAVMGGAACHWGGPSAYAEMMAAIHGIMFRADDWIAKYNFINDAGHAENGLYALKANYGYANVSWDDLKGFRSISSKLTGHGESHLFADGVMVSNGPLGSSIPISQGLAMADRLANNDRTTICVISDGAMMEGEAKEAVSAIPGFAAKGQLNPYVLVISDNNTKLSGRIDDDSFSMQPSFQSLAAQGWNVVEIADGHDLQGVYTAIEKAVSDVEADASKPIALWIKTIKGKGVKKTEESASGGHGYPLSKPEDVRGFVDEIIASSAYEFAKPAFVDAWIDEIEAAGKAKAEAAAAKPANPNAPKKGKIQGGFPKAMIAAAEAGLPVVSVSADLQGSTGVAPFRAQFPQLSFEVGIAESNMVSTAAGFSKQGYIPVVDTFAQFGVTKGALPLCMANLSQSPIIAVFSHIGFQDAADGASHQGLMYLAMSGSIPHTTAYCPASAEEAEWAMGEAISKFAAARKAGKTPDSVLFFCGRENFPISIKPEGVDYAWGSAMTVADTSADHSNSVVISANSSCVSYAVEAVAKLADKGIGAILLNNAIPNKPDVAAHTAALAKTGGRLVTVEDHQAFGGAGSALVNALVADGVAVTPKVLGVQGEFGQSAYQAVELYDKHGFGPQGIADAAASLI